MTKATLKTERGQFNSLSQIWYTYLRILSMRYSSSSELMGISWHM